MGKWSLSTDMIANSAIIPNSTGSQGALNAPLSATSLVARQGLPGYIASSVLVLFTGRRIGVIYMFL